MQEQKCHTKWVWVWAINKIFPKKETKKFFIQSGDKNKIKVARFTLDIKVNSVIKATLKPYYQLKSKKYKYDK